MKWVLILMLASRVWEPVPPTVIEFDDWSACQSAGMALTALSIEQTPNARLPRFYCAPKAMEKTQ